MLEYDPKIYNYANLKQEDKEKIDAMFLMYEAVDDLDFTIESFGSVSFIPMLFTETAAETVEEVKVVLFETMVEYMVQRIDTYMEDVESQMTEDHFYGKESL